MIPAAYRRQAIGVLSIGLIVSAMALYLGSAEVGESLGLSAALWRVGLLLGVLWYAYPSLVHFPGWILVPSILSLLLLTVRPRIFVRFLPILIPLFILTYLLRPRSQKKG